MVRDALGNTSAPVFTTITTSDCGARVPTASVVASSSTTYVLGVITLSATATSTETGCPARFQTTGFGYAWSIVSQPSSAHATLGSISGPTSGFRSDTPGVYVIRMVATGSDGVAALPVDTTITVSDCGMQPPVVSGFTAVQHRYDGELITNLSSLDTRVPIYFGVNVADENLSSCGVSSAPFTWAWTLTQAPAGSRAQLAGAGTPAPSLFPDIPGNWALQLVVNDSLGNQSVTSYPFVTSVCGSNAPTAVDGNAPALMATEILRDGTARTSSDILSVRLAIGRNVQLSANIVDADASSSICLPVMPEFDTYAWTLLSAPAGSRAALDSSGAVHPSFFADVPGYYQVQLVATDATGLSGPPFDLGFEIDCDVSAPAAVDDQTHGLSAFAATQMVPGVPTSTLPQPIVHSTLSNTSSQAFLRGVPVSLSANVVDVDAATGTGQCNLSQTVTYAWSLATAPAGSSAALNDPATSTPIFTPDRSGTYSVQLTLTDQSGLSSTRLFTVASNGTSNVPLLPVAACGTDAPSIGAIVASTPVPDVGSTVTLSLPSITSTNALCSASMLTPYRYAWTLFSAPLGSQAQLVPADGAAPVIVPDRVGTYQISAIVTDAQGNVSLPAILSLTTSNCGANTPSASIDTVPSSTAEPAAGRGQHAAAAGRPCRRRGSHLRQSLQRRRARICVDHLRRTCLGRRPPDGHQRERHRILGLGLRRLHGAVSRHGEQRPLERRGHTGDPGGLLRHRRAADRRRGGHGREPEAIGTALGGHSDALDRNQQRSRQPAVVGTRRDVPDTARRAADAHIQLVAGLHAAGERTSP